MLNATDTDRARFSHDCDDCAFVARIGYGNQDADLWYCPNHKELIVRFSSRCDHYMARPVSMLGCVNEPENIWLPAGHAFMAWLEGIARVYEDLRR